MDLTRPPRYDLGFPCRNPQCRMAWHVSPYCPFPPLPPPMPPTPAQVRAVDQLRRLEREGVLPRVQPLDTRWLWLVPPGLVVFLLLMLL